MLVKELRELLKSYSDDAILQISIDDGFNIFSFADFGIDDEYDKHDALVLTASLNDDVYFEYDTE